MNNQAEFLKLIKENEDPLSSLRWSIKESIISKGKQVFMYGNLIVPRLLLNLCLINQLISV